jgi:cell shape-determining protein MreC
MTERELLDQAAVLLADLKKEVDRLQQENKRLRQGIDTALGHMDKFDAYLQATAWRVAA